MLIELAGALALTVQVSSALFSASDAALDEPEKVWVAVNVPALANLGTTVVSIATEPEAVMVVKDIPAPAATLVTGFDHWKALPV
jgi:hypothetical protein